MPEKSFLKISGAPTIKELWEMAGLGRAEDQLNPKTFRVGDPFHDRLVRDYEECDRYYLQASMPFYEDVLENYDLYLSQADDERSPDELWRANIFVPLPFSNMETRNASLVNIITRADPIVQVEGVLEGNRETAKDLELVSDYTYRMNTFRQWFMKHQRAVGIQGTDFIKPVWVERAHNVYVFVDDEEKEEFAKRVEEAVQNGAPDPPDPTLQPKEFEVWRNLVNKAKKTTTPIPEAPISGVRQIVTFRGPELQRLQLQSVHVDPLIDEIKHQDRVFFRTLVPLAWVLERTGDKPDKPFRPDQVEKAMHGLNGEDLERYDREVSSKLGLNPMEKQYQDPFWHHAVELKEVYDQDPSSEVKFAVVLNGKAIINKDCFEFPTWSGDCLITGVRNIQVPGHFFGLSEYKAPKSLYEELRTFRNLRQDEATLRVLGVWTKLKEAGIPEQMYKIGPGSIMEVGRHDALQQVNKQGLPNEAYREPQEIKAEIADAHGIWDSTKGAPATVGRVTGVEFSGRNEQAQLRTLMCAAAYEDEMLRVNRQFMSLWAQNGRGILRMVYGGRLLSLNRDTLIESITMSYRFRGVTQAIDRNLQAQQLMMVAEKFGGVLTPAAGFRLLGLILETLNIRGLESVVTSEDVEAKTQEAAAAQAAQSAQQGAQADAAKAASVDTSKAGAPGAPQGGAPGGAPQGGAPGAPPAPPQG